MSTTATRTHTGTTTAHAAAHTGTVHIVTRSTYSDNTEWVSYALCGAGTDMSRAGWRRLRVTDKAVTCKTCTKRYAAEAPVEIPEGHAKCTGTCAAILPDTKFPTTSKGGRGTECRSCRNTRRAAAKA